MKKILYALLCSSLLSAPAFAGFDEAIQAFNDQNYSAALVEFSYLSDEGNADASYYLGKMYDEGLGVTQDKEKALAYFKKSDAGYNTAATLALANAFLADDKIAEYGELGVQYLKKAAYAGSGEAFYLLGNVYAAGQIVPKDYTYAFGYYLLGALKGDKKAGPLSKKSGPVREKSGMPEFFIPSGSTPALHTRRGPPGAGQPAAGPGRRAAWNTFPQWPDPRRPPPSSGRRRGRNRR